MTRAREIFLRDHQLVDGILSDIKENDEYIQADITFKDTVRLEFPITSDAGQIMKKKLSGDWVGQRVLIAKIENSTKPIHIAKKGRRE